MRNDNNQDNMKKMLYIAAALSMASCAKDEIYSQEFISVHKTTSQTTTTTITPTITDVKTETSTPTVAIMTVETPAQTLTYQVISIEGVPTIMGNGSVTETAYLDSKGDIFYNYETTPAEGWALTGYEDELGNIQWAQSLGSEFNYRINTFRFLPVRQIAIHGVTLHIYGSPNTSDATIIQSVNEGLAPLNNNTLQYVHNIHITEQTPYFFGGLGLSDGFVLNGTGALTPYVITHESGHVFAANDDRYNHNTWTSLHANHYVSQYGETAVFEYFAEAFAYYYTGNAIPDAVRNELELILN